MNIIQKSIQSIKEEIEALEKAGDEVGLSIKKRKNTDTIIEKHRENILNQNGN